MVRRTTSMCCGSCVECRKGEAAVVLVDRTLNGRFRQARRSSIKSKGGPVMANVNAAVSGRVDAGIYSVTTAD